MLRFAASAAVAATQRAYKNIECVMPCLGTGSLICKPPQAYVFSMIAAKMMSPNFDMLKQTRMGE